MSVTILGRVFYTLLPNLTATRKDGKKYSVTGHAAKSVLLAIADSADDFGENSYNSLETLALKSNLRTRSIPRVLRALQQNRFCTYKGLSAYGTSDYSVNLDKLAFPPKRRAKVGRPKTTDSQRETTDSQRETTDSESVYPLINHPLTVNDNDAKKIAERTAKLTTLYEQNIGAITPLMADFLRNAAIDYTAVDWYEDAFKIAVKNQVRKWNYVEAVLDGWKRNGRDWKPTQEKKHAGKNGQSHSRRTEDRGRQGGTPTPSAADLELARELKAKRVKNASV